MRDVAIVGGGPGGLHAAALLARAGLDVAVYEEHPESGAPVHCTGVLAADAFDEFDLDRSSILNPLTTARFFSPCAQSIAYTTSRLEAVAVDRLVFDQRLFDRARQAGAAIALGHRVDEVNVSDSGVRLRFRDGAEADARLAVLACGANYTSPAPARVRDADHVPPVGAARAPGRTARATSRCISAVTSRRTASPGSSRSGEAIGGSRASA